MRRLFVALSSAVSVVALTHMASAADLRVVTKAPPPLPPPVQDWSGIYVGIEGGYGWGGQDGGNVPFLSVPRRDQLKCTQAGFDPNSCSDPISDDRFRNDFLPDFFQI